MKNLFLVLFVFGVLFCPIQVHGLSKRQQKKNPDSKERGTEQRVKVLERLKLLSQWRENKKARALKELEEGKYADVYIVPAWPAYAQFFEDKHFFNVHTSYNTAKYIWNNQSQRTPLAVSALGSSCFTVRDLLLETRLLENRSIIEGSPSKDVNDRFLEYSADTYFMFQAREQEWSLNFSIARYVIRGSVACGLSIPLIAKHHILTMDHIMPQLVSLPLLTDTGDIQFKNNTHEVTTQCVALLDANTRTTGNGIDTPFGTDFRIGYGGNFEKFFKDLLKRRNIQYCPVQSSFGFGDLRLYTHVLINSSQCERLLFGSSLIIPCAPKRSGSKLWEIERGNGGFFEVGCFGAALLSLDWKINPHAFFELSWSIPRKVMRRIPKSIAFDGRLALNKKGNVNLTRTLDGREIKGMFTFGNRLQFRGNRSSFQGYDSLVREFSGSVAQVSLNKGFTAHIRLGNVWEKFLFRRACLDVYYDGRFFTHHKVRNLSQNNWDVEFLTSHSSGSAHNIAFDFSYQSDQSTRLRVGAKYTIAGCNVPITFDVYAVVNVIF